MTVNHFKPSSHEQIRLEHEALRELIGSIHVKIRNRSTDPEGIAQLLSSLGERLRVHFQAEESDGFFDRITRDAPRLGRQVDTLCVEHSQLLSEALELAGEAKHCRDTDSWWKKMAHDYQQLSKRLMQHEHDEITLMQNAYNDDIGTQD